MPPSPSIPEERATPERAAEILIGLSREPAVNTSIDVLRAIFVGARHADCMVAVAYFVAEVATTNEHPDFAAEMFHHLTRLMLAQMQAADKGGKPS